VTHRQGDADADADAHAPLENCDFEAPMYPSLDECGYVQSGRAEDQHSTGGNNLEGVAVHARSADLPTSALHPIVSRHVIPVYNPTAALTTSHRRGRATTKGLGATSSTAVRAATAQPQFQFTRTDQRGGGNVALKTPASDDNHVSRTPSLMAQPGSVHVHILVVTVGTWPLHVPRPGPVVTCAAWLAADAGCGRGAFDAATCRVI
jgi:hypothetical protein